MIKNDWVKKKQQYLANTFTGFFGAETKVNEISDKDMQLFIDYRIKSTKRKQTIKQEIGIIKHFYNSCLIKQGFVYRIPEFPEFKIKERDRAKRDDTFTLKEYDKLVRYLREWVKEKNVSRQRNAVKSYGNIENKVKNLSEWEWKMELPQKKDHQGTHFDLCELWNSCSKGNSFSNLGRCKTTARGNGRYVW